MRVKLTVIYPLSNPRQILTGCLEGLLKKITIRKMDEKE